MEEKMEDSPVQLSKEISYSISSMEHPSYQFNKINPLQQNSLASLATPQEITWEVPAYCWNPAKSYISFVSSIAGAATNKVLHLNQPWMNALTLSTRSGLRLLDLNSNFEMFYNMQSSFNNLEELETSDISRQSSVNNQLRDNLASQRYAANVGNNGTTTYASLNYVEQQYVELKTTNVAVPASVDGVFTKRIVIPLNKIRDTILAEDKDYLFNEILILRVQFGDVGILGSENTTAILNGVGGINSANAPTALGITSLSDITFWCAQEMNQSIVNSLAQKVSSAEGFEVLTPVSYIYKTTTGAASSSSITQRITSYHGRYCKKIIYSAYLAPSAAPTAIVALRLKYDRSNIVVATNDSPNTSTLSTDVPKLIEFYDNLNNNRLSQVNYRVLSNEDYDHMRRYHAKNSVNPRGTVIANRNIFYYNHHFVRDFTNDEESKNTSKQSLALGLDLTNEIRYDWYNVSQASIALDHYMIISCSKLLKVSSQGVSFN